MRSMILMTAVLSVLGTVLCGADLLTVTRNGVKTQLTSDFADGFSLVQNMHIITRTNPHLNLAGNYLQKGKTNIFIQSGGDDACPWNFNSTYIGANHGDSICSSLNFKTPQGFTEKDCGTTLTDKWNRRFHIVKVVNPQTVWVLSDNLSKDKDVWRFTRPNAKFSLKNAAGKEYRDFTVKVQQLYSPVRIQSRVYMADGKKVADKGTFKCKVFTVEEVYDIIGTDTILKHVLANKGKQVAFNVPGLEKVLTQKIRYDFYPNGSCIITHDVEFFRDVRLGYMGFQQSYQMSRGRKNGYAKHLYYIPKTIPFTTTGKDKKVEKWDFTALEDFTRPIPGAIYLRDSHCEDPGNPPERFIQYLKGHKGAPDVGFVTGYSLLEGITVPALRSKNNQSYLFLYRSHKTYPHAIDSKGYPRIRKGTKFHAVGYRQFFDPTKGYFCNKQGNAYIVYVDFHAPVKGKALTFPACYGNRKFTVLEKSKTVSFKNSKNTFTFDSTGKYGYCVLKFE